MLMILTVCNGYGYNPQCFMNMNACYRYCNDSSNFLNEQWKATTTTKPVGGCFTYRKISSCSCVNNGAANYCTNAVYTYSCEAGCYSYVAYNNFYCRTCVSGSWSNDYNETDSCVELAKKDTYLSASLLSNNNLYCKPTRCKDGIDEETGECDANGYRFDDVNLCKCKMGYYLNKGTSVDKSFCEQCPGKGVTKLFNVNGLELTDAKSITDCYLNTEVKGDDETGEFVINANSTDTCPYVE